MWAVMPGMSLFVDDAWKISRRKVSIGNMLDLRGKLVSSSALVWTTLSGMVIAIDQITKAVVERLLPYAEPLAVFPGLSWFRIYNRGAAFSMLSDASGWQRWVFTALALIVSVVLVVWLARTARNDWRTALPISLILGGAVGNVIDRIQYGHVVDFVLVYYREWSFPAFNVADSAISVGAVLLILLSLRHQHSVSDATGN